MKKILFSLLVLAGITATAQVKVGDNPTTIGTSSILELESTNKALVITRLNTNDITTPVDGMIIYDNARKCYRGYADGSWKNMTTCVPVPSIVSFTANAPVYNGLSVINSQGVAYNGEAVPAGATIVVGVNVTALGDSGAWSLSVSDAASGLAYTGSGTFTTTGVQTITLNPTVVTIPEFEYGLKTMTLSGAPFTNTIDIAPRIDIKSIPASTTAVVDVTHGTQTWMDRNLGARRVATAIDDAFSYGNLYQWGRPADGHEIIVINGATLNSGRGFHGITAVDALATSDTPGFSEFISTLNAPNDWRDDNNNNRWQTANQGPCPTGYHVPTGPEWNTADTFGSWNTNIDNYNSTLKIPSAGNRSNNSNLAFLGTRNFLASSTINGTAIFNYRGLTSASLHSNGSRAVGYSVRCIKN